MDGSEKIPFSIALSELVLDEAKVEILLISWHFLVIFWLRFWALSPPNMTRFCRNFDQRYVFHNTKTLSEQSFKIKCLSGNGTYPKLIVLVHFWAQFTPRKLKILPKPIFFPETSSL